MESKRSEFFDLVIVFFVFSFIGWIYEIILSICVGSLCDPGFLTGPYLAVYGGTIIIVFILLGSKKEKKGIIKIMTKHQITGIIFTTIIYMLISGLCVTSVEFVSAKLLYSNFSVRLWDYSVMPYNYEGVISLPTSLLWIVLIPIIMFIFFDSIYYLIKKIPIKVSKIISFILISIFVIDIIFNVSFILINGYSFRLYI